MAADNHNYYTIFSILLFAIFIWETQGKLTCPEGWTMYERDSKCIRMFNNPLSWKGARTSCKGYGGDLIRIDDSAKNLFIENWHKRSRAIAWIGLQRLYSWSKTFSWLDDGRRTKFTNWFGREPDNALNNEDCVSLVGWNVKWNDFDCAQKESYICEVDAYHSPPAICPANWILYGQNCFRLFHTYLNWNDARKQCQVENADLAVIPDEDTNSFLAQNIYYKDNANIYIGATDTKKEGVFQWIDPSVSFQSYQNWYPDQPNNYKDQDCVHVWKDQLPYWADGACTDEMHYMCEQKAITYPLICPSGWFKYSEYCFQLYNTPKSWTDARDYCRAQKGRLATIPDKQTNDVVDYAFLSADDTTTWIGLNDLDVEDTWTWVDYKEKSNYKKWYTDQPNNINGNQDCVAVYRRSLKTWIDDDCATSHPFICETSATRSPYMCSLGWSLYDKYCFRLHQTPMNWTDARDYCRAEQGHLATILDISTQYFLETEFLSEDANDIWLGLNDLQTENTWKWVDTSYTVTAKSYTKWEAQQPNNFENQDCVHIYSVHANQWADSACSENFHFLCQKPAGKVGDTTPSTSTTSTTSTTTTSTTTTTKPTPKPTATKKPPPSGGNPTDDTGYNNQATPAPQTATNNSKKSGLTAGGVAGIVIAVIIIIAAIGVAGFFFRRNRAANASTASGFDNAAYDRSGINIGASSA